MARAGVILWQADLDRRTFSCIGHQAERMLGYPLSRWTEPRFWERRLHPDDRAQVMLHKENRTQDETGYEMEYRLVAANGQTVWVHDTVVMVEGPGHVRRLHGIMLDVTAQKENEQQLQELSGRLINAQEAERTRIARELHDEMSQRLAILNVHLELLQGIPPGPSERWLVKLVEVSEEVKGIASDIHVLCYRLHPSKLEQLGLVTSLKRLCREMADQNRCEIVVTAIDVPAHLPDDLSLCLYRVAQEALHNAVKHSGANKIQVQLLRSRDAIRLTIFDNGHGFVLTPRHAHQGLGLVSMRERLRLVHGVLSVETSSQGVHIKAEAPLHAARAAGLGN